MSFGRVACQDAGMGADAELLRVIGPELELLLPELDEKARRLTLGAVARAAGDGGIGAVARLTGASWQTVANGAAELESGRVAPSGRVRRPGAGRKRLAETDPGLRPALLALVADSARGDPESPLLWTTKSVKNLAGELTAAGHRCSPQTAWRLLHEEGFSTQSNDRVAEGKRHPDRDAQFRYIAAQAREHLAAGQPVISVDAKKKEPVGDYAQAGREWRPKGDPVAVRSHDFPDRDGGHAIPYGIYDVGANAGFVNVGTDHNTAAFAVESVRRWWQMMGRAAYPHAARLLVCCDAGGANDWRSRAWKAGLAEFAQQAGLEVTVCHFPPGTSKWNKIEHRLFSQITLAWRGRPLTSHDVIINTIGAVRTATGLTAAAVLDRNTYPTGLQISGKQMKDLEDRCLTRHQFHGEWNYTLLAVPRPAPEPEPAPAPAWRCDQQTLNHPALTGIDPQALDALAAALQIPFRARYEQRRYQRHGRPRQRASGAGGHNRKLDLTDHVLAVRLRQHLHLPGHVIAALLGADRTTISRATTLAAPLLAAQPQPPAAQPPGIRLRTLAGLRDYAAGHGITIPAPGQAQTPPHDTLTTPATPQTHLNLERLPDRGNDTRCPLGAGRGFGEGAGDQDTGQVLAVFTAGADVGGGARALGGVCGGVGGRRPARQGRFDRGGAQRGSAHVDQGDLVALDGHADDGPVDGALGELLEGPARGGGLGHPDLGEQLLRLEHGLEQALEELSDRDLPGAVGAARHQRGVQREQHGGQIRGGVGVRDRAADRAAVPDLGIADLACRVREQRQLAGQQGGVLDVVVPGQRAERDVGAMVGDVGQVTQAAQVDDHLGGGQPQLHQRKQRMPSGQVLRVLAVLGGQVAGLLGRACPLVGER